MTLNFGKIASLTYVGQGYFLHWILYHLTDWLFSGRLSFVAQFNMSLIKYWCVSIKRSHQRFVT